MAVTARVTEDRESKKITRALLAFTEMCSNTSLSNSDGGFLYESGGGCGGYHGGFVGECIYSKKPKRQRVPKRGPGVAELEKILREQETRPDLDKAKNEGFSLVSSLACSYQPKSPNPQTATFYSNNSNSNPPIGGGGSGVDISGSGGVLPEHALWNSCEPTSVDVGGHRSASGLQFSTLLSNGSNSHHLFPSPSLMQRSQHSSPPPSIRNLFPHHIVSSSTTSSSAAPCHGREPPSNQTSYHHCSIWPEEDKMVGAKRSRPFSMEMIPPVPTFRYQVPTFSPPMNRLEPSLSCDTVSREMKPTSSSETNIKKCSSTDNEAADGNFLLLGSPASPPSIQTQRERPKFSHFHFQESKGDSQHKQAQGECFQKKPFYSFLLPSKQMGMVETSFGLNNERVETRGDHGIDLSLRL